MVLKQKYLTGHDLQKALSKCKNLDAVVCLCVDDFGYSAITKLIDESQEKDSEDVVGNILLKIHSNSNVQYGLNRLNKPKDEQHPTNIFAEAADMCEARGNANNDKLWLDLSKAFKVLEERSK